MQQQEQQHPTLSELLEHAQMDKTEYQQLKTLIKVLDLLSSWKPLPNVLWAVMAQPMILEVSSEYLYCSLIIVII